MTVSPLTTAAGFPHMRANSVVVKDHGTVVVIDCGGHDEEPTIRRRLSAMGIAPSEVELLVLTHLHYDHCENVELFDRAGVALHWRELESLERLLRARTAEALRTQVEREYETIHPYYLRTLCHRLLDHRLRYERIVEDRARLTVIDRDAVLQDGLRVVETPGHSAGHVAVRVSGARPAWIAGDAVISRDHLGRRADRHVCWDAGRERDAAAAVCGPGEAVVPGHGVPFDPVSGDALRFEELG